MSTAARAPVPAGGVATQPAGSAEALLASWGADRLADPFPVLAELRRLGAVHAVTLADGHEAWLVVRYDEALACLLDRRLSKDIRAALATGDDLVAEGLPGPAYARHMLNVDPPDHSRLRRLVAGAFSPASIEALRPRVEVIVDDLLDRVEAQGPAAEVDLVAALAFPLPYTVICELLGVAEPDRAALGEGLSAMLVPTATPEQYAAAKDASDRVTAMFEALVASKQAEAGGDLVSALLAARDGADRLSTEELLSSIFQLIVAGHDTTSTLIGNAVVALLRHPDQLALLRGHPEAMPAAVEELMRFDAPVPHTTFRYATEPIDLGGERIPPGAQVLVNLASANRDAAHYDQPDRLDVTRAPGRHLAFGHGIHHCLGAALARLEGAVALSALFARFPELRLAVADEALRWDRGDGLVLRGLSVLPVIPGPASPRPGTNRKE